MIGDEQLEHLRSFNERFLVQSSVQRMTNRSIWFFEKRRKRRKGICSCIQSEEARQPQQSFLVKKEITKLYILVASLNYSIFYVVNLG